MFYKRILRLHVKGLFVAFYEVDDILLDSLRKTTKIAVIKISICAKDLKAIISYRCADKFLALLWKQTSYIDQDLQHYTNTYDVQTTEIYCCGLYAISLGIVL